MVALLLAPLAVSLAQAAASAAPATRLSVGAVVDKMQKRYDQASDFRARFTQKYTTVAFNRTKTSTGEVLFRKPGLMRWNYDKPEAKMFLFNGQVAWLYEPEDKQAFKQDVRQTQLPAALSFLTGKGKLAHEFDVSFATETLPGRPQDYRLSLKPKRPQESYKSITFVVDPTSFYVTQSVLVDSQGNVNDIAFVDLAVNTKIPQSAFRWSPPPGTREIDTSKVGAGQK